MQLFPRRHVLKALGALGATVSPFAIALRPAGPVRLLVGYPPGGATDVVARLMARQIVGFDSVIVENRAGAGGRIAVDAVAKAKPDGLSLVVTPDFPLTVFPHLYRKLGYDPLKDLVPVAICGVAELALTVGPAVPREVATLADYLRWVRANPKLALYASPSPGSTPHFTGVLLAGAAKVELTHVAYKGGSQAVQDLLGGQVPASINPVAEVLPHLSSGKLRVLATSGPARSRFLPDVPTFRDAGYRDVVVQSWIGVLAPAGTPEPALSALEAAIAESLKSEAVVEGFSKFGLTAGLVPRQRFAAVLREDLQRWSGIVKASGFTVEE